jgi:peptidoglycan hydrolase CwlO-like protein
MVAGLNIRRTCNIAQQACALANAEDDMTLFDQITYAESTADQTTADLEAQIERLKRIVAEQEKTLKTRETSLTNKNEQIMQQNNEITNKEKLIDTRNRMLQLSMERNVYKKKVIYTLFSCIVAVLILMLLIYGYFGKKK